MNVSRLITCYGVFDSWNTVCCCKKQEESKYTQKISEENGVKHIVARIKSFPNK